VKEALYYAQRPDGKVECELCPHRCVIEEGRTGICRVRRNEGGRLQSLIYGEVASIAMDPIEKKPLYHFFPGRNILSAGTNGCNFRCSFCQNWQISQQEVARRKIEPAALVATARREGSIGVAFTYNEPLIWHEFVLDVATLTREAGMVNVLVTNGYVNPEPLDGLLPLVDALNIDVKSMRPEFYRKHCGGSLEPVLETCRTAGAKTHVELTNLVIPGENDSPEDFEKLRDWIADNMGGNTPLHLSAYTPRHKFTAPPTPVETLLKAHGICREKLDYVYLGNVMTAEGRDTLCRNCGALLVERRGYHTRITGLTEGRCAKCGSENNFRQG